MLTPARAWATIAAHLRPLNTELIPLPEALGRCLSRDLRADRDQPPADRSAMDGYAVRAADCPRPGISLLVAGESRAGTLRLPAVQPGAAARIYTGAAVPPGADAVVPVELTRENDGRVNINEAVNHGMHIRRRGEEARKGDILIPRESLLTPTALGLAAAVGKDTLRVFRQPRVAVLCTGEELHQGPGRIHPNRIRDANGPVLLAALRSAGWPDVHRQLVTDDLDRITELVRQQLQSSQVVILTGGVSVGRYDFVPDALRGAGGTIRLHGVRMKPGKPFLYATFPKGRHVFALPGNPLAVLNGFYEMVLPALRRLAGHPLDRCRTVLPLPLAQAVRARNRRTEYRLARLEQTPAGLVVQPHHCQGSADLAAAAAAHGAFPVEPDTQLEPGQIVHF